MELVRQVGNWSLLTKVNESGNVVYWIDGGGNTIDDVSEYMDEFDCIDLIECEDFEFVNKRLGYF